MNGAQKVTPDQVDWGDFWAGVPFGALGAYVALLIILYFLFRKRK